MVGSAERIRTLLYHITFCLADYCRATPFPYNTVRRFVLFIIGVPYDLDFVTSVQYPVAEVSILTSRPNDWRLHAKNQNIDRLDSLFLQKLHYPIAVRHSQYCNYNSTLLV